LKAIIYNKEQQVQGEGTRLVVYQEQTSDLDLLAINRENAACDPLLAIRLATQPS